MKLKDTLSKSGVGILGAGIAGFLSFYAYETFCPKASLFGRVITHGERSTQAVSLIFEKAPNEATSQLSALLHELETPATFFLEGVRAREYKKELKQLRTFELGVQAEKYKPLIFRKRLSLIRLIAPTIYLIEDLQRRRPSFFLPPYGWKDPFLIKTASRLGLITLSPYIRKKRLTKEVDIKKQAIEIADKVDAGDIILVNSDPISFSTSVDNLLEFVYYLVKSIRATGLSFWGLSPLLIGGSISKIIKR